MNFQFRFFVVVVFVFLLSMLLEFQTIKRKKNKQRNKHKKNIKWMELTESGARVKEWYVGNVSQNYYATYFSLFSLLFAAFVLFCWLILVVYAKQL